MRKALILTAAVLAAVFLFVILTLPPAASIASGVVDDGLQRRTLAGAVHVHSSKSDGTGSKDEIAEAASRAGLRFVIMTDHGDATQPPDPPAYRHSVLCVDAVEISTNEGHYLALDMPAAPYPLGGEASAVVEDVKRLGGFGVAAHPDSPKPALKWTDWEHTPVDGLEWLNIDSEWRDESRLTLARVGIQYFFRSGPALASLMARPATLARWDALSRSRPIVALAGHDAHGGWSGPVENVENGSRSTWWRGLPSYEASFRTFSVRAVLDREPSGDPVADSRELFRALRAGHAFTAIDAIAAPAWLDFRASSDGTQIAMGESIPFRSGTTLSVRTSSPSGARLVLLRDGAPVAESSSRELQAAAAGPGAYRVEVHAPRAPGTPPVPWLVSNPIYLTAPDAPVATSAERTATRVLDLREPGLVEKDAGSMATASHTPDAIAISYRLRPGERASQYVALAVPLPSPHPAFDAVVFSARASAPMRVSVQLRFNDRQGARWARSVYVAAGDGVGPVSDPGLTTSVTVPVEQLVPVDGIVERPRPEAASALLFVVDLTNAKPGSEGRFEISNLGLATSSRAR